MWMYTQIVALDDSTFDYYTPWFPKGGDNGIFTMELRADTLSTDPLVVTVLTKNREDEGSEVASVGTFTQLQDVFYQVSCTGLKELVRFKLTGTGGDAGEGVILRFLRPTWYDTAV